MAGAGASTTAERPLNVLFSARPFRGHLHPLIPLARAFRRGGHQVAVATAEDMATVVTGAGLTWLPAGHNPRDLWHAFPGEDSDYGYLPVKAKVADLLDLAIEQFPPDVVIREPTDLAPAIAAEVAGAVNVIYGLAHFIPVESWRILHADETIAELRREYGLTEDPRLDSLYQDLYITVLPRLFERPARCRCRPSSASAMPHGTAATAPPGNRRPACPASDPERPTVLVTLGTVYNTHSSLFSRFLEALADEPVQVICTLGDGADEAVSQGAPANVRFERYLPHSSILPHCRAMLCHAGFNTMLGCLSAGVPLVCVPLGSDQEYNARRIGVGGLGLWLADDEASPVRIREAMRRVLDEPSFTEKAQAFAEDMDHRPGFPATIRRIKELAAARPSRRGPAVAVKA